METTSKTNKTTRIISTICAVLLLAAGLWLTGYHMVALPTLTGITLGGYALTVAANMLLIAAGCIWLGATTGRRLRYRYNYTQGGDTRYYEGTYTMGRGGVFFASLLIVIGVFLLMLFTGVIDAAWRPVFISWWMLLIVWGFAELGKRHIAFGMALLAIGNFFIIPRVMEVNPSAWTFSGDFTATYWPVILVILGVIILLHIMFRSKNCKPCGRPPHMKHGARFYTIGDIGNASFDGSEQPAAAAETGSDAHADGTVNYNLVGTGLEQVFLEPEFRGGNIKCVMAGLELDLRRTSLPEGVTFLNIKCTLGGVNLMVPPEWAVDIRSRAVMGAFQDSRLHPLEKRDDTHKLVIIADCTLGGGEIR
jgi:hypothetical protein